MTSYEERLDAVVAEAERHQQLEIVVQIRCRRGHGVGRVVKVGNAMLYASLLPDAPATKALAQLARAAQRSGGRVGDVEFPPQGPVDPQYRRGVTARARGTAPPVPPSTEDAVYEPHRYPKIDLGRWFYALPTDPECPEGNLSAWCSKCGDCQVDREGVASGCRSPRRAREYRHGLRQDVANSSRSVSRSLSEIAPNA